MDRRIVVIAHNIRSAHNVGALLRTADGLGVERVFLTGYTPYPVLQDDLRLPHEAERVAKKINKTALDASIPWTQSDNVESVIEDLRKQGFAIIGLEQHPESLALQKYNSASKIALLLGSEVTGIDPQLFTLLDGFVELPMLGSKESFNVVEAASMALYHIKWVTM